jgi:hypothetical protein
MISPYLVAVLLGKFHIESIISYHQSIDMILVPNNMSIMIGSLLGFIILMWVKQ